MEGGRREGGREGRKEGGRGGGANTELKTKTPHGNVGNYNIKAQPVIK